MHIKMYFFYQHDFSFKILQKYKYILKNAFVGKSFCRYFCLFVLYFYFNKTLK